MRRSGQVAQTCHSAFGTPTTLWLEGKALDLGRQYQQN